MDNEDLHNIEETDEVSVDDIYASIGQMAAPVQSQEPKAEEARPELPDSPATVFLGAILAVVGAFVGSLLWILIDQIGFVAGIAGWAIILCAMKGYQMAGGKMKKGPIIYVIILSVVAIFFADMASYALSFLKYASKEGYNYSYFYLLSLMPRIIREDSDIAASFIKNLLVGYGLAIWVCWTRIKKIWSEA